MTKEDLEFLRETVNKTIYDESCWLELGNTLYTLIRSPKSGDKLALLIMDESMHSRVVLSCATWDEVKSFMEGECL